jgi:hypothetical protein
LTALPSSCCGATPAIWCGATALARAEVTGLKRHVLVAQEGRSANPRGAALQFGPDVVATFLEKNSFTRIVRSHECVDQGYVKMFDGQLYTVFSASNYCGVVGNEGAFMIVQDGKVSLVQYSASPKEQLSRYRMRHSQIENDVISKLLRRIAEKRLALVDIFLKMDPDRTGAITRIQWAKGLREALGIDVPFLEFQVRKAAKPRVPRRLATQRAPPPRAQTYLGLPKLGIGGTEQGQVDYMAFLDRYRLSVNEVALSPSITKATDSSDRYMEELAEALFKNRFELEALFRYFDANGDGERADCLVFLAGSRAVDSRRTMPPAGQARSVLRSSARASARWWCRCSRWTSKRNRLRSSSSASIATATASSITMSSSTRSRSLHHPPRPARVRSALIASVAARRWPTPSCATTCKRAAPSEPSCASTWSPARSAPRAARPGSAARGDVPAQRARGSHMSVTHHTQRT